MLATAPTAGGRHLRQSPPEEQRLCRGLLADDDSAAAGDDDDSAAGGGAPALAACCVDASCGSVLAAPLAWAGGEDPVVSLMELTAGDWNLVVSDADAALGGGGQFYELTLSLQTQ